MDLYLTDREHWQIDPKDQELLAKLYVRSETGGGYYHRHNGREMLTLEKPGYLACPQEILERVHGMMEDGKLQKPVSFPCGNPSGRADPFNSVLRRHFGSKRRHSRTAGTEAPTGRG